MRLRLLDLRVRIIPVLVFAAAWGGVAVAWRHFGAAPMMVGQAEPVLASVSCYKPGVLA